MLGVRDNNNNESPRSAAVISSSDCWLENLGFESHQSHLGLLSPGRLLPRAGSAMGPVGRLHRTKQSSFIHLTGVFLRVLL